jgi:predicted small secreted protein
MRKVTIRSILSLLAAASLLVFTGCETGEGMGEDIQDAGEGIQDASRDAQN